MLYPQNGGGGFHIYGWVYFKKIILSPNCDGRIIPLFEITLNHGFAIVVHCTQLFQLQLKHETE